MFGFIATLKRSSVPKCRRPLPSMSPVSPPRWIGWIVLMACGHGAYGADAAPASVPLRIAHDWTQPVSATDPPADAVSPPRPDSLTDRLKSDRFWLVSTRKISFQALCADLKNPTLAIYRLDRCGRPRRRTLNDYKATMRTDRPRLIYCHGNWRDPNDAIKRGLEVYGKTVRFRQDRQPIDWVIWSWPSEREHFLLSDAREKARRADTQSLYMGWLLRTHAIAGQPTGLIGFSFGGRIVTGALHALAGGVIAQRRLPGPAAIDAGIDVGLMAPALPCHWLTQRGAHHLATQNMDRMVLLYNRDDLVLKNYWMLEKLRGIKALGFTGPRAFAPRADGTPLPVCSHNCEHSVGFRHSERSYYDDPCYAGRRFSSLITSSLKRD